MKTLEMTSPKGPTRKNNWLARHTLFGFFALAILLSWIVALAALLLGMPAGWFQTIGAFGPFLAAVIVSAARGGEALKSLFHRVTNFRFGIGRYLLIVFGYVLLYLLVAGLSGAPLAQSLADRWPLLFSLYLPVLFTTYLVNPIGEETGWTGFALHHLQKQFRPWVAAVILGLVWALWHLPAYFVPSEMGAFSLAGFVVFTLLAVFTRLIWTWVTNGAHESGVAAILLHASSNAVSLALIPGLLPAPTDEQLAVSGLLLLGILFLAAVLILFFTRGRLSYSDLNAGDR
jgi:membrane protease YdiL (CAAX protease family)